MLLKITLISGLRKFKKFCWIWVMIQELSLQLSVIFRTNLVFFKIFRYPLFPRPVSWQGLFTQSYSKPALVINLGTAATSSQLLHHWRSTGYTTYMTFILFDFLLQPWYDFQYTITLCPLFFIVSSVTILMIMIMINFFISYNKKIVQDDLNLWQKKSKENKKRICTMHSILNWSLGGSFVCTHVQSPVHLY